MATASELLYNWLHGTANGGPNGDGRYPLIGADGETYLIKCPAAQALDPSMDPSELEVFANTAVQAANEASASAESASTSASNAASSASAANTSRSQALSYRNTASTHASTATTKASEAASSASAAAGSASTASTANTNAQSAKTAAEAARNKAQDWADKAEDSPVETGKFSARHWALKAAASAAALTNIAWSTVSGKPSITAGNGLTGGGLLDTSKTITLGTPGTLSGSTTNSVSTSSHTHALSANLSAWDGKNPSNFIEVSGRFGNVTEDYDVIDQTGFYTGNASVTGAPMNYTTMLHLGRGANRATQVAMSAAYTTNRMFFRTLHDTWNNWAEVWHSENFNPADKLNVSGGSMTGALTLEGANKSLILDGGLSGHDVGRLVHNGSEFYVQGPVNKNLRLTGVNGNDLAGVTIRWGGNNHRVWHEGIFDPGSKVDVSRNSRPTGDPNTLGGTLSGLWVGGTPNNTPSGYMTVWNLGMGSNSDGQFAWRTVPVAGNPSNLWFRRRHDTTGDWADWVEILHSGNQLNIGTTAASARSALGLKSGAVYDANSGANPNTIATRDGSGDIHARLFRSNYTGANATIGAIMTQRDVGGTGDNYIRPSTPAQVKSALGLDKVRNQDFADYGLSGDAPLSSNLDTLTDTSFFRVEAHSGTVGAPTGYSVGLHISRSASRSAQLAVNTTGSEPSLYVRMNQSGWSPWRTVWHSGNFDPSAQPASNITSGTLSDARLPSTMSGKTLNGLTRFQGSATSWGNNPNSGIRVDMGTSTAATWMFAGYSGSSRRFGIQVYDPGGRARFYVGDSWAELNSTATWNVDSIPTLPRSKVSGLGDGSGGKLKITTDHGWVEIGPHNTSRCHFYTDAPTFYFDKTTDFNGEIRFYNGPRVPKTFVQSGDPGSAASTGDLWIW